MRDVWVEKSVFVSILIFSRNRKFKTDDLEQINAMSSFTKIELFCLYYQVSRVSHANLIELKPGS